MVVFGAPMRPGDRIGVTAPSSGVAGALRPRFDFAVEYLRKAGYEVVLGECLSSASGVSAPARNRAAELGRMLADPRIAAVVPPWGGELAVELLVHLDWQAIAAAAPTWLVGYSDISTLSVPLTTLTGMASVHGPNLMETPDRLPAALTSWLDLVRTPSGASIIQTASTRYNSGGFEDWVADPTRTEPVLDKGGRWRLLDPGAGPARASGRLIGGCLETMSVLAGTPFGDVPGFAAREAPEGLIVYLEASEHQAFDVARALWGLRLAGWFDAARAVLIGRTRAKGSAGFTQRDAAASALGDLDIPVILDVDAGHVPPQMALVNGALADVVVDDDVQRLTQHLR